MEKKTLSVCMVNYNKARYIGEAIEAILMQSYRPIEIIIIDDASTDNSVEIIQRYIELDPIIRLIKNEKNMGADYNASRLPELPRGDYVCLASSKDRILPNFFEKSMNLLTQYPQAGLCTTLSLIIDEGGRNRKLHPSLIISREECFISPDEARSILNRVGPWFVGNSQILRRKALIDSGGFIPKLHSFTDGFIYEVIALKYGVCFIPEPLACWRRMDKGYSSSCCADPEIRKEMMQNATHLMRTTYRNLFSEEYIGNYERLQSFLMNLSRLAPAQEKGSSLSKVFNNIRKIGVMLYLYLFIKFRPRIRPLINRILNRFSYLSLFLSSRRINVK